MRRIYYVSYANCTDFEPRPGWYVGRETAEDLEGDSIGGPYNSKRDAEDVLETRDTCDTRQATRRGTRE